MGIAESLIDSFQSNLRDYFESNEWEGVYRKKIDSVFHDEPWLTLIAAYSIFGNQRQKNNANRLDALNKVITSSGVRSQLTLTSVDTVIVEDKLREIIPYRNYLRSQFQKENFHLYPDIRKTIADKLEKDNASFEGNTNLDLKIIGKENGISKHLFIEAKFLSDISYHIKYNPVRDQIIRNIDNGIDLVKDLNDFFFFLLTPQIFKPRDFGEQKNSEINVFQPDKGRFYCYKMKDYLDPANLKSCLPHRQLSDSDWQTISDHIGWITFEDFNRVSNQFDTFENQEEKEMINFFFNERNLHGAE